MSDSDKDSIKATPADEPSDASLERALRDAVKASFLSGKTQELTVKRLRTIVEKELGLDDGFFKAHNTWNAKSKKTIQDTVNEYEDDGDDSKQPSPEESTKLEQGPPAPKKGVKRSSPKEPEGPRKRSKPSPETARKDVPPSKDANTKHQTATAKGTKRSSPNTSEEPRKRQRPSPSAEPAPKPPPVFEPRAKPKTEDSASELSEPPSEVATPPPRPNKVSKSAKAKQNGTKQRVVKTTKTVKDNNESQQSERDDEDVEKASSARAANPPPKASASNNVEDDSSELSSLVDEEPAPKKRGRGAKASSPTPKQSKKSGKQTKATKSNKSNKPKAHIAPSTDLLPDEAEIKRLQSWLLKCGIRKMWHRELAPHSTPSAKIAHLRKMLKDAGMDGRYSVEKARAVKERRELEQDLEAVKEGEKRWGNRSGSDNSGDGSEPRDGEGAAEQPKRRLAKSLQGLEFLNDDDGEETD